jgi:hypothetical protein
MLIRNKYTTNIIKDAIKTKLIDTTIDNLGTLKHLGRSDSLLLIETIGNNVYALTSLLNNDNWISFGDENGNGIPESISADNTSNSDVFGVQTTDIS